MTPLPPELKIIYQALVSKDLDELESPALRQVAIESFYQIARGELRGKRLETHSRTGDLSDCFKIYFNKSKDRSPKYRIIFRYLPNLKEPKSLEIVAVGIRKNMSVYIAAVERLNR